MTPDADGVVALRADATKLQVIVVASDNGYCEMTVTKNPPVRLTFDEATGKAISEKRPVLHRRKCRSQPFCNPKSRFPAGGQCLEWDPG